jgi:hypothetical protein
VGTDGGDSAGAVTRGDSLGTGRWLWAGVGPSQRRRGQGGWTVVTVAVYRPRWALQPGATEDVSARGSCAEMSSNRSTIIPPSPIAMAHNGCDLSVLLKYKTLPRGCPYALYSSQEVQQRTAIQTLTQNCDETRLSGDSPPFLIVMSLKTPLHQIRGKPWKPRKSTTCLLRRNGTSPRKPRCGLGSDAIAICDQRVKIRQRLESTWRLSAVTLG